MNRKLRFIIEGAVIAAMYAAITLFTPAINFAFDGWQLRIAEALTMLPMITPAAIPGIFVGCLMVNIVGSGSLLDIIFGSLASLAAAYVTYKIKNKWLAALAPVLFNAVVVGAVISITSGLPYWLTAAQVGVGQAIACYALGIPLLNAIEKLPIWVKGGHKH